MTECPRCKAPTELVAFNPQHGGTVVRACKTHGLVVRSLGGEPELASEITYPKKVACAECGCSMDEGGQCYCCHPLESGFGRHWAQWRHAESA